MPSRPFNGVMAKPFQKYGFQTSTTSIVKGKIGTFSHLEEGDEHISDIPDAHWRQPTKGSR